MPTFWPGCHVVPRCRTRILPASALSPPNNFTPRRRPAESRPLREDPPAFLCAITETPKSLSISPIPIRNHHPIGLGLITSFDRSRKAPVYGPFRDFVFRGGDQAVLMPVIFTIVNS